MLVLFLKIGIIREGILQVAGSCLLGGFRSLHLSHYWIIVHSGCTFLPGSILGFYSFVGMHPFHLSCFPNWHILFFPPISFQCNCIHCFTTTPSPPCNPCSLSITHPVFPQPPTPALSKPSGYFSESIVSHGFSPLPMSLHSLLLPISPCPPCYLLYSTHK